MSFVLHQCNNRIKHLQYSRGESEIGKDEGKERD